MRRRSSEAIRISPGKRVVAGVLAAAVVATVAVVSIGFGLLPPFAASGPSTAVTLASTGLNAPPALCTDFSPAQELADARVANGSAAASPNYGEQFWMGLEQNFTSSLSYNVTLRAQNDSAGFGPAFLLNGLTDAGYWYQVGVSWRLPPESGGQSEPGFAFVYEVWNSGTVSPVYPAAGGPYIGSFSADDGDVVLLGLRLTAGQVEMTAYDWNTTARAAASYSGFAASRFLGLNDETPAFPTSLLTEWYHALPYYCSDEPVEYTDDVVSLGSVWLRVDERNLTGVPASQLFDSGYTGQCCVFSTGYEGVSFQSPGEFQPLSINGTTIFANADEFVTP